MLYILYHPLSSLQLYTIRAKLAPRLFSTIWYITHLACSYHLSCCSRTSEVCLNCTHVFTTILIHTCSSPLVRYLYIESLLPHIWAHLSLALTTDSHSMHTWYVRQAHLFSPYSNLAMPLFPNGMPLFHIGLQTPLFLLMTLLYSDIYDAFIISCLYPLICTTLVLSSISTHLYLAVEP